MLYLVANRVNTIKVHINNGISLDGFSAVLTACGVSKHIDDLKKQNLDIVYTAQESNNGGNGVYGELIIKDPKGAVYYKIKPQFMTVPPQEAYKAIGTQFLDLTISTNFKENYNGGGGGVTKEWVDREIKKSIAESGEITIETAPVELIGPEGPVTKTVHESMQDTLDIQTYIEHAERTHTIHADYRLA